MATEGVVERVATILEDYAEARAVFMDLMHDGLDAEPPDTDAYAARALAALGFTEQDVERLRAAAVLAHNAVGEDNMMAAGLRDLRARIHAVLDASKGET